MEIESVPATQICKHCQRTFLGRGEFCCNGCEAVFGLISQSGLQDFYKFLNARELEQPKGAKNLLEEDLLPYVQPLNTQTAFIDFDVDGMTCAACVWLLNRLPVLNQDILNVDVQFSAARVRVFFKSDSSLKEIHRALNSLGFKATPAKADDHSRKTEVKRQWLLRVGVAFASFLATMHISLMLYGGLSEGMSLIYVRWLGLLNLSLALPSLFYCATPFYLNAYRGLRARRLNLDFLVTLAIAVGAVASTFNLIRGANEFYFDAVTMLVFLLLLGRMVVFFIHNSFTDRFHFFEQSVLADKKIEVGQVIGVKSGEEFPCDGSVVAGHSYMQASWLTGEEHLVPLKAGDPVLCGAQNVGDLIEIRVERLRENTKIGQLIQKLSLNGVGRVEKFSGLLESYFVLGVIVMTALVALKNWQTISSQTLVALLLVSCPCAFGLGIPMVFVSYFRQAFKRGLIVKGFVVLEKALTIKHVAFDKTGTLTRGALAVSQIDWKESGLKKVDIDKEFVNRLLAWTSARSQHPIMQSLRHYFKDSRVCENPKMCEQAGLGISGFFEGQSFRIGHKEFVCNEPRQHGPTQVWVGVDGETVACINLSSSLRDSAEPAVKALQGQYDLSILSGDSQEEVEGVGAALGLPHERLIGAQSPEDKVEKIKLWQKSGPVMLVGDGINDSLAFKAADLGVGVSGGVIESLGVSDVFLKKPDLTLVADFLKSARRAAVVVFLIVAISVFYNALGIYFVLKGALGPIVCALLMPISSVTVVTLAYLAPYFKRRSS